MQNLTNIAISYERLDILIEWGRQARSDAIRTAFASASVGHLIAWLARRLSERPATAFDPARPAQP